MTRTIEQITADLSSTVDRKKSLYETKKAQIAAATATINAKFALEEAALNEQLSALQVERDALLRKTASHQLEGKMLTRQDHQYSRSWRGKTRCVTRRAKVVVIRGQDDMPTNRGAYQNWPEIGQTIIQLVDAKGERLTLWQTIDNLAQWTVVDEVSA